jgi:CRP/FNR family transcriptional regulator, cyclic AMP receptor protein
MTGETPVGGIPFCEVSANELTGHPFLRGLPAGYGTVLAGACLVSRTPAGQRLFDEGEPATRFWLIRSGHVALDVHVPGRRRLIVETLGPGDLLGLSWLLPPFQWQFGAVAVTETEAFELDGTAVRAACDGDPGLGYQLLRRLLSAASGRLQATRIRMLDLYAASAATGSRS